MKRLLAIGGFFYTACILHAAPPAWWSASETEIVDSESDEDNYAPANLGQLKHVAKQAQKYLNANLPWGAGEPVTLLIEGFEPRSGQGYTQQQIDDFIADNYSPINLGQLKAVAKPFYDRLRLMGYDTKANLIERGYPDTWEYAYPWDPATPVEDNYAPANLGQLKLVFSFDLAGVVLDPLFDSDENDLPDGWEHDVLGGTGQNAASDPDGDGLSNLTEYLAGSDPNTVNGEVGPAFTATGLRVYTPLE
jgi:hypothetical protein